MNKSSENFRLLLGLKLKQLRQRQGLALKDLAEKTGLSISFLSEIEKGRKYPKPDKIMALASALGVGFDELVSLKVDRELDEVSSLLNSPFIQQFPFELFGVTARDFLALATTSPSKAGAFIRTFLEIGESYDMQVEHFLLAALRSYQAMNLNYFEEIERAALEFVSQRDWPVAPSVEFARLKSVFVESLGYKLVESDFEKYPQLQNFRSIWVGEKYNTLVINKDLLPNQKAFIVGREIGFSHLGLSERPTTSSWIKVESFDQVLNNFKASYFSGALLIHRDLLRRDLQQFFERESWDGQAFLALLRKYDATPEMFLYRLSQILPRFFNLKEIYYIRFYNESGTERYAMTKGLNLTRDLSHHRIGLNEHFCRRWLSISLLRELADLQKKPDAPETLVAAQRSRFVESDAEFLTITLARPLVLTEGTNASISLGFVVDDNLKHAVRFWDDAHIPRVLVNETCERCGLSREECDDRVAEPEFHLDKKRREDREAAVEQFIEDWSD